MSAMRYQRPVSETIASGFFASRSMRTPPRHNRDGETIKPNLKEMYARLAQVALRHRGVVLYAPKGGRWPIGEAEIRLSRTSDVTNNSDLLGHLRRDEVYYAIRSNVPSFNHRIIDARVESVKPLIPLENARDSTMLRVGLANATKLGDERDGIRSTLAGLANIAADELSWPTYFPSLAVATFSPKTSDEAPAQMQAILEDYIPFEAHFRHGRLIPTLD
jgi:hypothetical protein